MALFKDYEECKLIVMLISEQLKEESIDDIKIKMDAYKYLIPSERTYQLINTLKMYLWDIPEAIETGFSNYIKEMTVEYRDIIEYHNDNCPKTDCQFCIKLENNKRRWNDERAKPRICYQ